MRSILSSRLWPRLPFISLLCFRSVALSSHRNEVRSNSAACSSPGLGLLFSQRRMETSVCPPFLGGAKPPGMSQPPTPDDAAALSRRYRLHRKEHVGRLWRARRGRWLLRAQSRTVMTAAFIVDVRPTGHWDRVSLRRAVVGTSMVKHLLRATACCRFWSHA